MTKDKGIIEETITLEYENRNLFISLVRVKTSVVCEWDRVRETGTTEVLDTAILTLIFLVA